MPYRVSNSFKRGTIRTYFPKSERTSGQTAQWDTAASIETTLIENDVATSASHNFHLSRRRCADNGGRAAKGAISIDLDNHVSSSAQALEPNADASSTKLSSSPPSKDTQIFSDPVQSASVSDLSSAPSSPPARLLSPVPTTHRRIFWPLKRKQPSSDERSCTRKEREPLSDVGTNARKVPRLGKNPVRTQMRIDLGGDPRKTCAQCGMEYVPSNSEDAALHHDFHYMNATGIEVGTALMRDASTRLIAPEHDKLEHGEAILMVDRRSSLASRRKVKKVLEVVNTELSAADISDDTLWGGLEPASRVSSTRKTKGEYCDGEGAQFKAFVFLSSDKCVGLCLIEKISFAYKVVEPSFETSKKRDDSTRIQSSSISISDAPEVALLGVMRIWTSRSFRRRGIARVLLDCGRKHFFYGLEVTKDLVAFSQPTESGARLARRWYGTETGWHVFKDRR